MTYSKRIIYIIIIIYIITNITNNLFDFKIINNCDDEVYEDDNILVGGPAISLKQNIKILKK